MKNKQISTENTFSEKHENVFLLPLSGGRGVLIIP